jgi:DNA mismatch repair protein MutL
MSSIIQLLPDHVANQIAGEVVQRPASLSKNYLKMRLMQRQVILNWIIKDAGKHSSGY